MKNLLSIFAVLLLLASFSGCSEDGDDDVNVRASKVVADPNEQDEDDKILDDADKPAVDKDQKKSKNSDYEEDIELQPGETWVAAEVTASESESERSSMSSRISQAISITGTYGTRNGGRQAFRINPRFGSRGQAAYVVFNDRPRIAYRVKLYYANRINSGSHRGFVFKLGSMGDFYAHSPYGRHPQTVRVYY